MPPHPRSGPSGERWPRSSSAWFRAAFCNCSPPSLSPSPSDARLRKLPRAFICCRTYDKPTFPGPSRRRHFSFHLGCMLTEMPQVNIRKVKLLKLPKFDLGSLMALHGESTTDEQGQKIEREFKEQVLESVYRGRLAWAGNGMETAFYQPPPDYG